MNKIIKKIAFFITIICLILLSVILYYSNILPDYLYCDKNKDINFNTKYGISAKYSENLCYASTEKYPSNYSSVTLMFMKFIPIKDVQVKKIDRPELSPCGKPFGIKMLMDGVMVIRTGAIPTVCGNISPAEKAGIKSGDIIKSINEYNVYSNSDIEKIVSDISDTPLNIYFLREGIENHTQITPVCSAEDGKYKLGIWVRDSSAGIGTITYCDKTSKTFGGLGHPVCDTDTGKIIPLSSGEVMEVSISGIKKGSPGNPGELLGFFNDICSCGTLSINNKYGVFGNIDENFLKNPEMPMALKQEIKTGDAIIYSTILGNEPQAYDIEIEKIDYKSKNSAKNMIIHITDPELIEKTGGIVQGMSGSPIIQNDMLVGAITHVFVNDPTRGYAVFSENMYEMSHAA